jgi:hypothetical protein
VSLHLLALSVTLHQSVIFSGDNSMTLVVQPQRVLDACGGKGKPYLKGHDEVIDAVLALLNRDI